MSIKMLNPYLNFNGTAAKAIALYEKVLGAKVETVMRMGDVPADMKIAPEHKDRIMHSRLNIDGHVLMAADSMPGDTIPNETNCQVCLDFTDPQEMARKFDALAQGGKVRFGLSDTFWGAKFGMLTDAYGIRWIFNCEHKRS